MPEYLMVFIFLLLIPFIPALVELAVKKDKDPLTIKQDYSKDPAFFGKSFSKILEGAISKVDKELLDSLKSIDIPLSSDKPEKLIFFTNEVGGKHPDSIVFVRGQKSKTVEPLITNKEVVAYGSLRVEHSTSARSMLIFGSLEVKAPLKVARWIHVEGETTIKAPSILGINFYSSEKITIDSPCTFTRIYAKEINLGWGIKKSSFDNPARIEGGIKSKGAISIKTADRSLIIEGNIISEKDIIIEGDVWVKGNIFSHEGILIIKGVIVGMEGAIKSVVGKKSVIIGSNAKIYGYVHTDGEGIIKV